MNILSKHGGSSVSNKLKCPLSARGTSNKRLQGTAGASATNRRTAAARGSIKSSLGGGNYVKSNSGIPIPIKSHRQSIEDIQINENGNKMIRINMLEDQIAALSKSGAHTLLNSQEDVKHPVTN